MLDRVRLFVESAIAAGYGIVTGGALGVDEHAVERALRAGASVGQVAVVIPTPLDVYAAHYRRRASEEVIREADAENLLSLLTLLSTRGELFELTASVVDESSYFARNTVVVGVGDELAAFQLGDSHGTQDAINKARTRGLPVRRWRFREDGVCLESG